MAQQRERERLEQVADWGASTLLQRVAETGEHLRAALDAEGSRRPSALYALADGEGSSTALLLQGRDVIVAPNRKLRYLPEVQPPAPLNETVFAAGEALEFRRHDYAAAALWFKELARRSEGSVRAAALMRAARNYAKQKNTSGALAVWAEIAALEGVSIEGESATLVARFARLPLLAAASKGSEAELLMRDLQSGRFALSRTSYEFYADELSRMTGLQPPPPLWEEAAHAFWSFSRSVGISSGERVIWVRIRSRSYSSGARVATLLREWRSRRITFRSGWPVRRVSLLG